MTTALINQTPHPSVNREFKDMQDDVARVACLILERALSCHNNRDFKTFNIFRQAVQDQLVPGVGASWHTYGCDIEHKVEENTYEQDGAPVEYDEVVKEYICDEYVYWEDLLWSPARTWDEISWIARKVYMTKDKLIKRFGKKTAGKIPLDYSPKKTDFQVQTQSTVFQQATIYEIWDKEAKQVLWFSKHHDKILDTKDDFLGLEGFYPCPKFLTATVSNGEYIPIPDYHYASDQYRELNEINTRISLLVRACRVAGAYDKASPQIQQLTNNAAENTLIPVDQWAAFAEKGGFKGVVDWLPLDQIVAVLDQLLKNREDVKSQIYEVTGMADIIRGASKASETLGAQKIKAQYASMRIQDRQKAVVEYCSTVFDIQGQLMRKHVAPEEIAKLAQVQFMNEDQQLVIAAMQLLKNPEFTLRARVESDTLSDIDFQAEKQDRMEYMVTITNYLKEMLPLIREDPTMGPFVMRLLQFSLAGFKVGKKFEGELDKTFAQVQQNLMHPQPPKPSPEEQRVQGELKLMEQEGKQKAQEGQQKLALQAREGNLKLVQMQREGDIKLRMAQQQSNQKIQQGNQQLAASLRATEMKGQQDNMMFWDKMRRDNVAAQNAERNATATAAGARQPK
jgi:hypothetical protein